MADSITNELFPFLNIKLQKKVQIIYQKADNIQCPHEHHYIHQGLQICDDCGILMEQITHEKDWKSYGNSISREGNVRHRKGRGITKDLIQNGFSPNVSEIANKYYQEITKSHSSTESKRKIYRSNNRNALMAVCVFFAQIDIGEPKHSKNIKDHFIDLTQQKFNDQLDQFYEHFPNKRCTYVEPKHLVSLILKKIGILEPSHYKRVRSLCLFLTDSSELMLSSKPESIAAAIVYLHLCICKENIALTKTMFAKSVDLSDATIDKLVKDAAKTLNTKIIL